MSETKYGYLTIVAESDRRWGIRYVVVRCDCGVQKAVSFDKLKIGHVKSCGCMKSKMLSEHKTVHGDARTKAFGGRTSEYCTWKDMTKRCEYEKHRYFSDYGGRGIKVCTRWRESFTAFLEDMGRKPTPKHSLDRINNNGNYEPSNCRWATPREQAANTRRNQNLTAFGNTFCVSEWVRITGLTKGTIMARLKKGWSHEETLTRQPRGSRRINPFVPASASSTKG